MTFDLNHWNNPRASIANRYENNDYAYVTRGAKIAIDVLQRFDISPSQAKNMSILDYGCGTGRASAFLALFFGKVIGYDPNKYCINMANEENVKSDLQLSNLVLTSEKSAIIKCDIAVSTNVIEHLNHNDQKIMVENLKNSVRGKSLLWYNPASNEILKHYITSAKWEDRLNVGRIQIDFFDFNKA